jgi:hypothetical protein
VSRPRVGRLVPRFTDAAAVLAEVTGVPGVRGTGGGLRFAPRTGPATLIGMSAAADGRRLAWLEGEALGEALGARAIPAGAIA